MLQSPYWEHIKEVWDLKDHPNVHFMFYEDMKKDIMEELKRLNNFLETGLSDAELEQVKEFTSFTNMKKREENGSKTPGFIDGMIKKGEGSFIRKGNIKF